MQGGPALLVPCVSLRRSCSTRQALGASRRTPASTPTRTGRASCAGTRAPTWCVHPPPAACNVHCSRKPSGSVRTYASTSILATFCMFKWRAGLPYTVKTRSMGG